MSEVIKYFKCEIKPIYIPEQCVDLQIEVTTHKDRYVYKETLGLDSFNSHFDIIMTGIKEQIKKHVLKKEK